MKSHIYNISKFLIGWPLSIGSLYFIWKLIEPHAGELLININNINYTFLSIGIICFIIFYFLRSYIWYRLVKDHAGNLTFKRSSYLWGISEIKRYIPGKFWFILGRTLSFADHGIKKRNTGQLMIIELEIFAISAFIISLLTLPFINKYFLTNFPYSVILNLFIIFSIIAGTLLYIFNQYIVNKFPPKIQKILNAFLPTLKPQKTTLLLFISMISLTLYGIANYFVILSINFFDPQLIIQFTGVFTLSFLLGFLSFLTPAGLGIREGVTALGLAKIMPYGIAAFGSLFGRMILIFSEVLFILVTLLWTKIKIKNISRLESWIGAHPQETVLFSLILLYIIYFTITSFLRYDNFYTGRFDLGNMAQTIWNTSRGRIFQFTNPNSTETISRLAFHADFMLLFFTPFYYIWANPKILLLLQTIIVGCGAVFVYLIANYHLKNKNLALTFSFLYLINPAIQRTNLYDFHAVTLVTTFLLGAYYFYAKKNYKWFLTFALLAALTKEEIWLITAAFGIFIFIFQKKKILGGAIFMISSLIFYFLIWHAIPNSLGSGHFALSYFSEYGDSPGKIIKTTILSPQKIIQTIQDENHLRYLRQIFQPLGYVSLISPLFLIFAIPDLLINLLSNNTQLHQIYYQYTAPISPFIFITSILGTQFLMKKLKIPIFMIIIYLMTISILSAYYFGPLPGAIEPNIDMYTHQVVNKNKIDIYLNSIPEKLSISASNNIGSHLSHREKIYKVPIAIDKADMVIFLLTDPMSLQSEKQMIQKLNVNSSYFKMLEDGKFIVFKKKNIL